MMVTSGRAVSWRSWGKPETDVAQIVAWRRRHVGLTGPGLGWQDGRGMEELGEASAAEEAAVWRSQPCRAAGGLVVGCQGPSGRARCRRTGGRAWAEAGGASGKHRGPGGVRGLRPGGGGCGQRSSGGARGWRQGGTCGPRPGGASRLRQGLGRGSGRAGDEHLWEDGGISQI
jgi:hypothetical protein